MATPEEDNHAAKQEANGKLDELNDKLDTLKEGSVDRSELPRGATNEERIDKFKDEVEETIDQIQQAINTNQIVAADRLLRKLKTRIKKVVNNDALERQLLALLIAVRKAKRKITAAPIALARMEGAGRMAGDTVLVSAEEAVELAALDVADIDLASLQLPAERLDLVRAQGLQTVGDLLGRPFVRKAY